MMRSALPLCLGLVATAACDGRLSSSGPLPPPAPDAVLRQMIAAAGAIPIASVPSQNPARVELGRALMFDKILSGNRDVACATCHNPATAAGDGLSLAIGTGGSGLGPTRSLGPGRQFVPRNAPSLLNTGLGLFYVFWDGRLTSFAPGHVRTEPGVPLPAGLSNVLAAQAMLPVLNRREMRGDPGDTDVFGNPNELAQIGDGDPAAVWQAVMRRLLAIPEYVAMFEAAFPDVSPLALGFEHAAEAIAAFQIAVLTKPASPFDRYVDLRIDAALSPQEKRGAMLFFGEARCSSCHHGPLLGGREFANVGAPQIGPGTGAAAPLDVGRGELLNQPFYRFFFRVPPLRNVALTAPYTHAGAYATLEAVVRHYNDVPRAVRTYDVSQLRADLRPLYHGEAATIDSLLVRLDHRVRAPLGLTEAGLADLVAFLRALTDPAARELRSIAPARVPSGLPLPE